MSLGDNTGDLNTFLSEKIGDNVQVIIFEIDNIKFAINIMDVKEIKEMERIRRLPNAQPFVKGLLNLRGDIIPVIDLKKRLELDNLKLEDIEKLTQMKKMGSNLADEVKYDNKDSVEVMKMDNIDNQENNSEKKGDKEEIKANENNVNSSYLENELLNNDNSLYENSNIPHDLIDKNIIICNIENTMFGILIDRILQVSYLNENQFESAPKLISTIGEKFLIGFAKINKQIIPILNLYKLIFEE